MTLTLDNRSKTRESSLTQALRQIKELNSKIAVLEEQHLSYVQKQQNLISAIAEICVSPIQEIEALRILVCKGEGECRRYLRSLLVNQRKNS
jgi:CII-binding regulator of phage lambda lysogenization HflD